MQPRSSLAPLDPHKTRALTTIYAPRKLKPRKNKTAQTRMLEDLPRKPTLSPFHPLPAIGQTLGERSKTKLIVFDINKNERPRTMDKNKLELLKPLTPLRIHGFTRKSSLDPLERKPAPQQLLRENTYEVIEPVYVNAAKVKKKDSASPRKVLEPMHISNNNDEKEKISPKSRFKKAALQVAKLKSVPETGKLLCLRERETFSIKPEDVDSKTCRLQKLPESPTQKLTKLSEIFQGLDMQGRHRDKMKKENSWF